MALYFGNITSLAVMANRKQNLVHVVDAMSGAVMYTLRGHTDGVTSVCFSSDCKHIASTSYDCSLRIWNVESASLMHTLVGSNYYVNAVSFSPDGTKAVAVS